MLGFRVYFEDDQLKFELARIVIEERMYRRTGDICYFIYPHIGI